MGFDEDDNRYFSSEMKCLVGICSKIKEFPPGHFMTEKDKNPVKYYSKNWMDYSKLNNKYSLNGLRDSLENSVKRQLMSDVPYGVLLSGGLDSSITSAIAKKYSEKRIESDDKQRAWWPQLHSFSVGLDGSPDLKAAQEVAKYIGTVHHEIKFTIQEGLDAIREVIYHLETYDTTTIRAATPMYLMSRKIKALGIKMVLSGEGADEIFAGYLYFHKCDNALKFDKECRRLLENISYFDVLRSDRCISSWGLEPRTPFLDKSFVTFYLNLPLEFRFEKNVIEKKVVRDAFTNSLSPFLPNDVLFRKKEAFSDGVSSRERSWYKIIQEKKYNINNIKVENSYNRPRTEEQEYYRNIFNIHFPNLFKLIPYFDIISIAIVYSFF
mgnify:CR=1 FL=1